MNGLPVKRTSDLADSTGKPEWLSKGLLTYQAVGILDGHGLFYLRNRLHPF